MNRWAIVDHPSGMKMKNGPLRCRCPNDRSLGHSPRHGGIPPGQGRRAGTARPTGLREQLLDDVAVHVGETKITAGMAEGQLRVVEAEKLEQRRVQVVDVD